MEDKPKKKQVQKQPKTHPGKTKEVVKARKKKIVQAIIEGKTQKQAGIEAGLSPKTAETQVCMILKEPAVRATFAQLLAEKVPDDFHAQTYREAMEATKVISANVIAINGEGMADAHSQTKDFIDVPDYAVRLKAADSVAKLKGYVQERTVHGFDNTATEMMISVLPTMYAEILRRKFLEMAQKGRLIEG
jgi:phage terminase small subunit